MPQVIGTRKNILGQKFGMLTVIRDRNEKKGSMYLWDCLCDCGKIKIYQTASLLSRGVKTCGCRKLFKLTDHERFFGNIEKTDSCWIWKGCVADCGYGVMTIEGKYLYMHRYSYQMHKGNIKNNLQVCHSCDNRKCVNPDHLWLGSFKDNIRDMIEKERNAKGSFNGSSKLSEDDIIFIRNNYSLGTHTQEDLSKLFNVSRPLISMIVRGKIWKHI